LKRHWCALSCARWIFPSIRTPPQQSRQAIIFGGLFDFGADVRHYWLTVNYLVALTLAMMGWLWLIVWIARQLI
jgi:hypothetical protein